MNKHVESLPKVDKSITFHYCRSRPTVICDVLQPVDVIFLKTSQTVSDIFAFQIFLKVGKFATQWTSKSQTFKLRGGALPPDSLARGFAPGPLIIGASHLYLGASNSLTPALPVRELSWISVKIRELSRRDSYQEKLTKNFTKTSVNRLFSIIQLCYLLLNFAYLCFSF